MLRWGCRFEFVVTAHEQLVNFYSLVILGWMFVLSLKKNSSLFLNLIFLYSIKNDELYILNIFISQTSHLYSTVVGTQFKSYLPQHPAPSTPSLLYPGQVLTGLYRLLHQHCYDTTPQHGLIFLPGRPGILHQKQHPMFCL